MVRVVKKFSIWYNALWLPSHWCCDEHTATLDFYMFSYQKPSPALFLSIFFVCLIGTYILMLFTGASYEFVIKFNVYFIASWFP